MARFVFFLRRITSPCIVHDMSPGSSELKMQMTFYFLLSVLRQGPKIILITYARFLTQSHALPDFPKKPMTVIH